LFLLITITGASALNVTITQTDFVNRDKAWTIIEKDYITENIDFDFKYINDETYRVDWAVNPQYKADIVGCYDNSVSVWEWIGNLFTHINIWDLDDEKFDENFNSISNKYFKGYNKNKIKKDLEEMNIPIGEKTFQINNNTSSKLKFQDNLNSKYEDEIYINYLEHDSGSFFINLKYGFKGSNGAIAKFGFNTTIAQFNNSLTVENLTFTTDQNFTRYLSIPRYAVVSGAFINITGFEQGT